MVKCKREMLPDPNITVGEAKQWIADAISNWNGKKLPKKTVDPAAIKVSHHLGS